MSDCLTALVTTVKGVLVKKSQCRSCAIQHSRLGCSSVCERKIVVFTFFLFRFECVCVCAQPAAGAWGKLTWTVAIEVNK